MSAVEQAAQGEMETKVMPPKMESGETRVINLHGWGQPESQGQTEPPGTLARTVLLERTVAQGETVGTANLVGTELAVLSARRVQQDPMEIQV